MWSKFSVPVLASILILGAFTVGYSIDDAFAKGDGKPKVTICHVDQETGEEKTISISNKALSKHLANHIGDHSGECVDVPEPVCGDGTVDAGEQCDDGNTVTESCNYSETSCTVCAADCTNQAGATSFCGDSNIDSANGETCDDGASNGTPGSCNATCNGIAPAVCGDNIITSPETCEPPNTATCDASCQLPTGTSVLCICLGLFGGELPLCEPGLSCNPLPDELCNDRCDQLNVGPGFVLNNLCSENSCFID